MAKILIIDDDDSFIDMLHKVLERNGYELAVARNGEEGKELCREMKPDLVITDLFMPSGGMSNINEILKEFPKLKIIAVSGGNVVSKEYLDMTKSTTRVQRIFQKPFAIDEMFKVIKELIV